jgi:aerobic-type carbon monoxide dehydrogenase small subunit (CoxS/CutS family)
MMKRAIRFQLNGHPVNLDTDDARTLLWVLRGDLELTGTKYGCGEGVCGACTVAVDGVAVRSCQTPLAAVDGKKVVTIEGLERDGKLHPLQQAFIDHGAFQCGYCTSGMLMNAWAFLQKNPHPTHSAIVDEMGGNLCRCSAYARILTAIEETSKGGGSAVKSGGGR